MGKSPLGRVSLNKNILLDPGAGRGDGRRGPGDRRPHTDHHQIRVQGLVSYVIVALSVVEPAGAGLFCWSRSR